MTPSGRMIKSKYNKYFLKFMVLFTIITKMFFIEFNTILIVNTSCSLDFFFLLKQKNIHILSLALSLLLRIYNLQKLWCLTTLTKLKWQGCRGNIKEWQSLQQCVLCTGDDSGLWIFHYIQKHPMIPENGWYRCQVADAVRLAWVGSGGTKKIRSLRYVTPV